MEIIRDYIGGEEMFLTHTNGGSMDYSESIIYIRTFTTRCENEINRKQLDKALADAEHIVAEAIQLRSTLIKMQELA
jgi:hypothetical protein